MVPFSLITEVSLSTHICKNYIILIVRDLSQIHMSYNLSAMIVGSGQRSLYIGCASSTCIKLRIIPRLGPGNLRNWAKSTETRTCLPAGCLSKH